MRLLDTGTKRRTQAITAASAAVGVGAAAAGAVLVASNRARSLVFGKTRAAFNAVTPSGRHDYDDVTLTRKVETEVFRPANAPKGAVSVNAENGVVFLRGQVKTVDEMKSLEAAVLAVDGVKSVNNLLHLPNTDALTKTEGKARSLTAR